MIGEQVKAKKKKTQVYNSATNVQMSTALCNQSKIRVIEKEHLILVLENFFVLMVAW